MARYDGGSARALAVDAAGNVYVTGGSDGSGTGRDYATLKYDSDGNELWVARYDGPGSAIDNAQALALDAAGNVYVTGESWGSGTNLDYATVKYDSDAQAARTSSMSVMSTTASPSTSVQQGSGLDWAWAEGLMHAARSPVMSVIRSVVSGEEIPERFIVRSFTQFMNPRFRVLSATPSLAGGLAPVLSVCVAR